MADIGSLAIRIRLDDTQFQSSSAQVNRNLKTLGNEMTIIRNKGKEWGNSVKGLTERQKVLKNILSQQEMKVRSASEKYKMLTKEHGEGSVKAQKHAAALNKLVAQFTKTEAELKDVNQALTKHRREMGVTGNSYTNFSAKAERLSKNLSRVGTKLHDTGQKARMTGRTMTTSVTLPIVGLGVATLKTAADFEASMSKVAAISGATGDELKSLENQAKELGRTTKFSASEAAEAQTFLAMAGFKSNQILKAMPGLLSLAAAGNLDLGRAADIASNIMSAFTIKAENAGHVSDVLAEASANANTNVEQLGTAMQYLGPVSNALGWSLEEATSAVMALSDAGLQGEKAGAAFSTSLTRISKPTKEASKVMENLGMKFFTAEGKMKTMPKVIEEIERGTKGLTNEQKAAALSTIFGQEAYKAWEVLLQKGSKSLEKNTKMLVEADGASKRMADTMSKNTKGSFKEFQSAAEGLAIELGDVLLPIANDLLKTVTDWTRGFSELDRETQKQILTMAGLAAAAGPVLMGLGSITTGVGLLMKGAAPVVKILGKGAGLAGVLTKLPGPIGLVAGGLAIATGAFIAIKDATEEASKVSLDHVNSLAEQKVQLEELSTQYNKLRDKNKLSNDEMLRFRDIQSELKLAKSKEEIKNLTDEAERLSKKSGLSNDEMKKMLKLNDDIINLTPAVEKSFSDRGEAIIKSKDAISEVNESLAESIRLELENQRIKNDSNLEKNIRKHIENVKELQKAEKERNAQKREADEIEATIAELKIKKQRELNEKKEGAAVATQLEIERQEGLLINLDSLVSKEADKVSKKMKAVDASEKEIQKTIKLYDEMINVELQQAHINEKGNKGIAQLDDAIKKNQERISQLQLAKEAQGGLNQKQQEELDRRGKLLSEQQKSRQAIRGLKEDQEGVNQKIDEANGKAKKLTGELGRKVTKPVKVDDNGGASALHARATKKGTKGVNVTDYGKASTIHKEAGQTAFKGIRLSLLNSLSSIIPSTFNVGVNLGARASVKKYAKGTRNAPGGLSLVGEEGPELLHLPQGAKVVPNRETEAVLRNWNIPMLAKGGVALTKGMAMVGEKGRELLDMRGATTAPLPSTGTIEPASEAKQPILLQLVTPDSRVLSEMLVDDIFSIRATKAKGSQQNFRPGGRRR